MFVASYCRVSTDKADQINSFESQQRYFKEYIERQPDWELYKIYADEGITGTSTRKRVQFNRMIADAFSGKFQLIITKEVSRFSRNILDTIAFTRELRGLGVGVLFVNDGINTLEPDAELRLSILGSIAQEESRKTSSRVKWGQTRRMEMGVVFGRSMLGYDVKNGVMTVNPEGAELVRLIFEKYGLEKKGTTTIARELEQAGYRTCTGTSRWSSSHILKILRNEKYAGDLIQKKTYTPDYLTHEKKYNHGQEPQIVIHNHHEAIIDRALWDRVQSELNTRSRQSGTGSGRPASYLFSGKIRCGECGSCFVSRKKYRKDGKYCRYWGCYAATNAGCRQLSQDRGCDVGLLLRDDAALMMVKTAVGSLSMDRERICACVASLASEALRFSGEAVETEALLQETRGVLDGEIVSENFYRLLLEKITVYKNRKIVLKLRHLPQEWTFYLDSPGRTGNRSDESIVDL